MRPRTIAENRDAYFKRYFSPQASILGLKQRAIQGGMLTYLSRVFSYLVQMAGTVILARLLAPEDFGLIAMVTSINGVLLQFRDIGLSDAVIQAKELNQKQMSTLFWVNALLNIVLSLAIAAASTLIAEFYREPRLATVTVVLSLSFIFYGMSDLHFALLKRAMHFWSITIAQTVANVISICVAVYMAWSGHGYWSLVAKNVASAVCMVIIAWIFCNWRPSLPSRNSGARPLFLFGANTVGYLVLNYFTRHLDKTIVGKKFGATELGYYDKAFNLFLMPVSQLTMALHHVAVTTLSKLRDEEDEYRRYYLNALAIVTFLGMPVCAFLSSASHEIVLFLLGPQWVDASGLFMILTISGGIHIVYSTHEWLHVSLGRADRWIRWGAIAFIVSVSGYLLGMMISVKAVAIAYSASIFLMVVPAISYAGKPIGLRFRDVFSAFWRYLVAAALAGISCRLFLNIFIIDWALVLRLCAGFVVYLVIYLTTVIVLHGTTEPIRKFVSIALSFFNREPR